MSVGCGSGLGGEAGAVLVGNSGGGMVRYGQVWSRITIPDHVYLQYQYYFQ